MFITSARLQNYRSYQDSVFEFGDGVNIIVGPNASGKTNLLDALHYVASGAPMKPSREHIVRTGSIWARADVLTNTNQKRSLKYTPESSSIIIDDVVYKRLPSDRKLPLVVFEPNHLYFITTSPDMRRQLIDDMIEKSDTTFARLRTTYTRTLRQRNALLKQPFGSIKGQMFAWDIRLSELAGRYVEQRNRMIEEINNYSDEIYSRIAGKRHTLKLKYETKNGNGDYASKLLSLLQQKLAVDHQRGFTSYGPHRDDIAIMINSKDMRDVASRGETRSILLSLKVREAAILEQVFNHKPLFLLDDVFGELDGSRRKHLIDFMRDTQTFITTTDADIISHNFAQNARVVSVFNG